MQLTPMTFLIVCPLVFLAGLVDAIGGGGGLISLPAYLLAGLPAHTAIATNKMSSACGTTVATARLIKNGMVNFRLAAPAVAAAICGSSIGARLSLRISEGVMLKMMIVILPVCAFLVMNRKLFNDSGADKVTLDRKTVITALVSAFLVGIYDGFYGPGTGTFLVIAFTVFARLNLTTANAQAKVINLTTNITALTVFFLHGEVLIPLGLAAAACNMLGGYLGIGLMMKNGSKIVRPSILIVLALLLIKIVTGM